MSQKYILIVETSANSGKFVLGQAAVSAATASAALDALADAANGMRYGVFPYRRMEGDPADIAPDASEASAQFYLLEQPDGTLGDFALAASVFDAGGIDPTVAVIKRSNSKGYRCGLYREPVAAASGSEPATSDAQASDPEASSETGTESDTETGADTEASESDATHGT